jgi:E1A/CREB-binding protein
VPFCSNIKQKLKQQQMQQRLAQAQLIRRRMAMTTQNSRGAMSTTPTGGKPAVMGLGHQPQGQQPAIMGIPSHQQGIGMKPGTQVPPANVLQVVKQVDDQFNSKVFIFYTALLRNHHHRVTKLYPASWSYIGLDCFL